MLAEAKSELTKQENKWNLFTLASGANLCSAIETGGRPSRKCTISKRASSTARRISHEREALRDTQIGSIHDMGELKRAQEFRIDEFSVQKSREIHYTIQRLTSPIQELQERVNCMNGSGEFQESNYSGKFSHVPSQQAVIRSYR